MLMTQQSHSMADRIRRPKRGDEFEDDPNDDDASSDGHDNKGKRYGRKGPGDDGGDDESGSDGEGHHNNRGKKNKEHAKQKRVFWMRAPRINMFILDFDLSMAWKCNIYTCMHAHFLANLTM